MNAGPQHGISIWSAIFMAAVGAYFAFGPIAKATRESRLKLYVRRGIGWIFFAFGLLLLLTFALWRHTYLN
jgi:hypothetical protein